MNYKMFCEKRGITEEMRSGGFKDTSEMIAAKCCNDLMEFIEAKFEGSIDSKAWNDLRNDLIQVSNELDPTL